MVHWKTCIHVGGHHGFKYLTLSYDVAKSMASTLMKLQNKPKL